MTLLLRLGRLVLTVGASRLAPGQTVAGAVVLAQQHTDAQAEERQRTEERRRFPTGFQPNEVRP